MINKIKKIIKRPKQPELEKLKEVIEVIKKLTKKERSAVIDVMDGKIEVRKIEEPPEISTDILLLLLIIQDKYGFTIEHTNQIFKPKQSFSWLDYLKLARQLGRDNKQLREAKLRTGISRLYFCVHNVIKEYFERNNVNFTHSGRDHRLVIEQAETKLGEDIANLIETLLIFRNHVEYRKKPLFDINDMYYHSLYITEYILSKIGIDLTPYV